MSSGAVEVAFADATCMVATWKHVVFPVMGRLDPTADATRAQAKAIEAFATRIGKRSLLEVSILDDEFPLPNPDVRAALEEASPIISPYYAAVACVYEGAGFRAAFVRGVLATLQLVSRADFPQKVFSVPAEAAAWTASHSEASPRGRVSADELLAAIGGVRTIATERGVLGRRSV